MASTVREFAVKLTVDATEFQTSITKATSVFEGLIKTVKSLFGTLEDDITKATKAVNSAIDQSLKSIEADAKNQMNKVIKDTETRVKAVRNGTQSEADAHRQAQKEIEKIRRQAAKDAAKLESQRTREATKAIQDRLNALKRTAGQFKLDIVQIETEGPIDQIQDLGRAIANTNRSTQEQIRRELRGLDSQREEDITRAERNLLRIIEDSNQNQQRAIRRVGISNLRIAGDNAEERVRMEQRMQRQLADARAQGQARLAAVSRTATQRRETAPGEQRTGRIGRGGAIISEIGQSASRATAALGPLGGALQALGPIGLAVGASVGVLLLGFNKVAAAAGKFNDGLAKIKTTIDPSQFEALNGEMAKLRDFSTQTGVPIEQLSEGVFQAASAVAAFKNDVGAAAEAVKIASVAAVGMGTDTSTLTSVMGDLANSFGIDATEADNLQMIMDSMSVTFRDGKISGDELSSTIVKGAKSMSLLSADATTGIKALSAMTASLTASGLDAARTSTSIDALNNELLDLPTATKLAESGLKGISTEGGKVQVDFEALFQSAGNDFEKFAQMLGSDRAKLAFRTLSGEGDSAFLKISEGFKNVSGVSQNAFDIMQDTSAAATARLDASMENLAISMGGTADAVMTDLTNFAASSLGVIAELFKSSEQEAAEFQGQFTKFSDLAIEIGNVVGTVSDEIQTLAAEGITSGEQVDEAIASIGETANEFKDDFPIIADEIQNIINAEGEKTVETLALLNEKLKEVQDLAKAEAFLTSFESFDASLESSADRLNEIGGSLDGVVGALGMMGTELLDMSDPVATLNESFGIVKNTIAELRAEQQGLNLDTEDGKERAREIRTELGELSSAQRKIGSVQLAIKAEINKEIQKEIENAKVVAELNETTLDIEELRLSLEGSLVDTYGDEGETLELINSLLDDNRDLTEEQVSATADNLDSSEDQLSILEDQSSVQQDIVDLTDEEAAIKDRVNEITSDILDNESLSTDEKLVQLGLEQDKLTTKEAELNADLQQLNAELAKAQAQMINNDLSADAQATAEKTAIAIKEQVVALAEEVAIAASAASLIGGKISDLENKEKVTKVLGGGRRPTRRGGGGGSRSRDTSARDAERAAKDSAKAAEKAEKDRQKRADDSAKRAQKAAEDRAKAEEKLAKERQKREEEARKQQLQALEDETNARTTANIERNKETERLRKHSEALALAEKKIREDVSNFAKDLQSQSVAFVGQSVDAIEQLIAPFQSQAEKTFKSLQQIAQAATDSIEDTKKQIAELKTTKAGKQTEIGTKQERIDVLEGDEDVKTLKIQQAQFDANTASITKYNNAIKLTGDSLQSAAKDVSSLTIEQEGLQTSTEDARFDLNLALGTAGELSPKFKAAQAAFSAFSAAVSGKKSESIKADLATNLDQALRDVGASAKNGRLEYDGFVQTFTEWKGQVVAATNILNKLAPSQTSVASGVEDLRDDYEDLKKELKGVTTELNTAKESVNSFERTLKSQTGKESVKELKDEIFELDSANTVLKGTIDELSDKTGEYGSEAKKLGEDIDFLSQKITGIDDEIAELNDTLTPKEGMSQAKAKEEVKRFEAIALGFSAVSTELDKVIALQDQAMATLDPQEAAAKFKESDKLLQRIIADFDLFGISIEGLVKDAKSLSDLKIDEILAKAFGADIDLTDQEKAEKARTKVLLESAVSLLQLQTRLKNEIIDTNEAVEDNVISTNKLLKIQEGLQSATDKANSFLAEGAKDTRTNLQKLTDDLHAINKALNEQKTAAKRIKEEQESIQKVTEASLATTEAEIELKRKDIADLVKEKSTEEDPKKQAIINEQIAAQKQILDELIEAQEIYNASLAESERILKDQNSTLSDIKDKQVEVVGAIKERADSAKQADSAVEIEKANKAREKHLEQLQKMNAGMQSMASLSESVIEGVGNISDMLKSGDEGGAILAGAELTKKVGQAFLNSPIPFLQTAGAVLLGAGIVGSFIAKIAKAINGQEMTALDIATLRMNTIEQQNAVIENQLQLMSDLVAIGDASVDTARERLSLLQEQRDTLIAENREMGELLEKSPEELIGDQQNLKDSISDLQLLRDNLEESKKFSNEFKQSYIKTVNDILGTSFDPGLIASDADIDTIIANVEAKIKSAEGDLSQIAIALDINEQILAEQFGILDERISSAGFKIEVATILGDTDAFLEGQDDKLRAMKDKFEAALARSGVLDSVGDLSKMTAEELKNIDFDELFAGMEVPEDVTDSWTNMISDIDGAVAAQVSFLQSQMEAGDLQKDLIAAREKAGKITSEKADQRLLKILKEQLDFLLEQRKILGSSVELNIMILDLQGEINGLKEDGNDIDSESNRLLMESIRLRQEQIEMFRQAQSGAPLTTEQQKALDATDEEIRSQLKASGMTDTQIEEFMGSLPAFEKGGIVPETGIAVVHKKERILTANQNKDFEEMVSQFAKIIGGKNAIANGTDDLTKQFTRIILQKEATTINNSLMTVNTTLGDIVINIPSTVSQPNQVAEIVKNELVSTINSTVQRAIDQNKLDFRGKRI